MENTVKINIPDGYVIEWNKNYNGVEIKADGEHFVIDANKPSYYCNWNDAMRYYTGSSWKLPTVKQLKVLAKHIDKINEVIRENNGYEIFGWLWSCEEKDEFRVWSVYMDDGGIYGGSKGSPTYVRAVSIL